MNTIRQTALLNKRELENAIPPSASWHVDYRDTAWVYIGGLPLDLSEGDVVTIFSQFGHPTHINLIRDKETGKIKGFGFLKYEDQRSCDLAVDNLGGAKVLDRMLRVDHTRYKRGKDEDEDTYRIDRLEMEGNGDGRRASDTEEEDEDRPKKRRKMLKEEMELQDILAIRHDGEEDDPMRDYLIKEKRGEVEKAREREERKQRHKHKHHHRRRDEDGGEDEERRQWHKHRQRSPDEREDRQAGKVRGGREAERRGNKEDRRRSRSTDRDDYKRERRPRSSRSPSEDGHRRQRNRSRSPKRRGKRSD